jgi:hypothetical protein
MEAAVLRRFRLFSASCDTPLFDGETMNDRFFSTQREAFEGGQPCFLEEPSSASGSSAEVDAFLTLREAWLENAFEFVAAVASEDVAELMFNPDALRMHVWASVHEGTSTHVPHDHENSALSGVRQPSPHPRPKRTCTRACQKHCLRDCSQVFYVSVPPHAGEICFEDPRSTRLFWSETPFAARRLVHTPRAGELLLFPPWLVHSVGSSESSTSPRISISFNLFTTREGDDDLEALANARVGASLASGSGEEIA